MHIFIAEGYQPDCDGPVRWLESVHATDLDAAREAVMSEHNSSGDLSPNAVYTYRDAVLKFGGERIMDMLSNPLGYKDPDGSYCDASDEGAVPFYYFNLNRR